MTLNIIFSVALLPNTQHWLPLTNGVVGKIKPTTYLSRPTLGPPKRETKLSPTYYNLRAINLCCELVAIPFGSIKGDRLP